MKDKEYVKTIGDFLIPKTNDLIKLNDEYYIPKSVIEKQIGSYILNKNKENDFELER